MKSFQDYIADFITEQEQHNPRRLAEASDSVLNNKTDWFARMLVFDEFIDDALQNGGRDPGVYERAAKKMRTSAEAKWGKQWVKDSDKLLNDIWRDRTEGDHKDLDDIEDYYTSSSKSFKRFASRMRSLGVEVSNFDKVIDKQGLVVIQRRF